MRWLLLVLALAACKPELPIAVMQPVDSKAPRIAGTQDCRRTPDPPAGLVDVPALEAYIAEMSDRLEACADKVDLLNERIRRSRR